MLVFQNQIIHIKPLPIPADEIAMVNTPSTACATLRVTVALMPIVLRLLL